MVGGLCGAGAGIAQVSGVRWRGCEAFARDGVEREVLTVSMDVSGIGAVSAQSVEGDPRWEWEVWLVRGGVLVIVVSGWLSCVIGVARGAGCREAVVSRRSVHTEWTLADIGIVESLLFGDGGGGERCCRGFLNRFLRISRSCCI